MNWWTWLGIWFVSQKEKKKKKTRYMIWWTSFVCDVLFLVDLDSMHV